MGVTVGADCVGAGCVEVDTVGFDCVGAGEVAVGNGAELGWPHAANSPMIRIRINIRNMLSLLISLDTIGLADQPYRWLNDKSE